MYFLPFDKQTPSAIWLKIELCWNELLGLSKLLHRFVIFDTCICQSGYMYFSPFDKQTPSGILPRIMLKWIVWFVKVVTCISHPLPNKKKTKAWPRFWIKLKDTMPWVRCSFGNVLIQTLKTSFVNRMRFPFTKQVMDIDIISNHNPEFM